MFVRSLKAVSAVLVLALATFLAPAALAADADPAARQIENFYATLVGTMKRGPELGIKGRYQAMAPGVDAAFDIPTMIQFIVGTGWLSMSDADHRSLVEAFRRMTIANYANNFDSFHGEHFDVDPNVQTRGPDRIVQTTLTLDGGKSIPLVYRMRLSGGAWKIIDIFLNGYVSELATRRSDFAATLTSGGAPAVVKQLNTIADNLLTGTKAKSD